jgi:hypothetical protein
MNNVKGIASEINKLLKKLKENSANLHGFVSDDLTKEKEAWVVDLDDEGLPRVVIDTGALVLCLRQADLQQMLSALEFLLELDKEERETVLNFLNYSAE